MTHRNFCLVDLLCVVAMFRIFRIWVKMQNANIYLVALVKGTQCRFPDQHRTLHLALVPLPHYQAKVLTQVRLRFRLTFYTYWVWAFKQIRL